MSVSLTVSAALKQGREALASISDTPYLDAQVLLAHVLKQKKEWVLTHSDDHLSKRELATFVKNLRRLIDGEALPYLLGSWEFFGRSFQVTEDVLIPRPETEELVEIATHFLRTFSEMRLCADIGTGSGCIAISLAIEIPDLQVLAVDVSPEAIEVARANAITHGVEDRVTLLVSDLLCPVNLSFGLICANLPYIPSKRLKRLAVSEREPVLALNGGVDGLDVIRRFTRGLPGWLAPGGRALLEVDSSHARTLAEELASIDPAVRVEIVEDLSGKERIVVVDRPELEGR